MSDAPKLYREVVPCNNTLGMFTHYEINEISGPGRPSCDIHGRLPPTPGRPDGNLIFIHRARDSEIAKAFLLLLNGPDMRKETNGQETKLP